MDYENRILLEQEIRLELDALNNMEMGTEVYKVSVDGLTKLLDRSIALDKLTAENDAKEQEIFLAKKRQKEEQAVKDAELQLAKKRYEDELAEKELQRKKEKKDRLISNGFTVAGIVVPTIVTIWGTIVTLEFEKTGSVTTVMGRGFINKLFPKYWK